MAVSLSGAFSFIELGISATDLLALVALCTVRVYAALLVLPATNDQLIQGVVRNGLALMIGLFVALGQPLTLLHQVTALQLLLLAVKEAVLGMLIGFAMGVVFWTAEAIGMLIDNIAGFNNIQQNNPSSGQQSTPIGNTLAQLAIVGFYMLGGMMVFVGLLLDSHRWWPLGGVTPDWAALVERFMPTQVTSLLETALKIAGPIVVTLVLIDLCVGLLGKAAEKLEPNNLGQPIKSATAIVMIVLLISVFFDQVRDSLTMRAQSKRLEQLHTLQAPPR